MNLGTVPDELVMLEEWKRRLCIEDWSVSLFVNCDPEDMKLDDCDGCVSYEETTKTAVIQIADPSLLGERLSRPFDFETVLVHELLHLKFCLLERGDDWDSKLQLRVLHQIIDDLSRAFVDAKRFVESKEKTKKTSEEKNNV